MCHLSIGPTIKVRRSHSQSGEHAAYLLAVFGGMVNDLNHDNPRLHEVPIRRSELSLQLLAGLVSRQGQQSFSADAPFRGGLGFSVELLVTKGGASLNDLAVRPV